MKANSGRVPSQFKFLKNRPGLSCKVSLYAKLHQSMLEVW